MGNIALNGNVQHNECTSDCIVFLVNQQYVMFPFVSAPMNPSNSQPQLQFGTHNTVCLCVQYKAMFTEA